MATIEAKSLQRILEGFTDTFTPELAAHFANLPPSSEVQARLDELGDKANEGLLTEAERSEYETYVEVLDVIARLRTKVAQRASGDRNAALPEWCNVYAGLSAQEIAELEQTILTRADLNRASE